MKRKYEHGGPDTHGGGAVRIGWTLALTLTLLWFPAAAMTDGAEPQLREMLFEPVSIAGRALREPVSVAGRALRQPQAVRDFYAGRDYAPAWLEQGRPTPAARQLLAAVQAAQAEGLRPADYHVASLSWLLAPAWGALDAWTALELDLLLTDAFVSLAADSANGRPDVREPGWLVEPRPLELSGLLVQALAEDRIAQTLGDLLPTDPRYRGLREARARYRAIADVGGWPQLPPGPLLQQGMRDPRVPLLRARLRMSGDYRAVGADPLSFDDDLEGAVRAFQRRHGLLADGRVGEATRDALNVDAALRLAQIELNMERWRRLPRAFGERHLLVNIADYSLEVVEGGETVLHQRVVVGQDGRRTPVMSGRIGHLVLNPSWEIPTSIMVEDMLPLARRNPWFFEANGIDVLRGWSEPEQIDPFEVDWNAVDAAAFPYRFRQRPGPRNALGQIKFMFPNRQSIYLHDSPDRALFSRPRRAYSSGCVRVERPLELAAYLLRGAAGWDEAAIARVLREGGERSVGLPQSVPVYLLYWTAWVDADGELQFRDDVYRKDQAAATALAADADTQPAEPMPPT